MAMARRAFCAWVLRNAVVAWALAGGLLLAALTLRGSPVSRNCPHGNLQTRLAPMAQQPPWQAARDCPIYILDVSAEVAPAIGIPKCDISDPQVWPLARPGKLPWELQRMEKIPHMHYMYASQYWLNQALRNATGVLTDNIDEACLVWVDTYCYNQWYVSWRAVKNRPHIQKLYPSPAGLDVEQLLTQAVDHILDSPRFKKRHGRDYVFHTPLTNPGKAYKRMCTDMLYSHTLVVEHPLSCINKGRPKVSLRETQILPYSAVANAGNLSAPIVGSLRPTFMYMQANCGTAQCGMLMRLTIAEALAGSPADVQVKCANRPVSQPKPHAEVQLEMRRSVFCLLVPGDNVSSGRLTEAILAGCIPVFIGDPWHELPFNHGEVEWPNIAVFIKVQSPGWTDATICAAPLKQWSQKADVTYATVTVASLDGAFAYLRALSEEAIHRRQAALERERTKFMYAAPPGRDSSALSDIVFTNLLGYGRRLLETPL